MVGKSTSSMDPMKYLLQWLFRCSPAEKTPWQKNKDLKSFNKKHCACHHWIWLGLELTGWLNSFLQNSKRFTDYTPKNEQGYQNWWFGKSGGICSDVRVVIISSIYVVRKLYSSLEHILVFNLFCLIPQVISWSHQRSRDRLSWQRPTGDAMIWKSYLLETIATFGINVIFLVVYMFVLGE